MFKVPEEKRVTLKNLPWQSLRQLVTTSAAGCNGAFYFALGPARRPLFVVASDGESWDQARLPGIPWEHVSVRAVGGGPECPIWEEMCFIKNVFWDEQDAVIQIHPPRSEYVNYHPNVLHMWRPIGIELPRPPKETVGPT